MNQYILANSIAVYGVGVTALDAYNNAREYCENLPAFDDLPDYDPASDDNGGYYVSRATPELIAAVDHDPQCARCRNNGVEDVEGG